MKQGTLIFIGSQECPDCPEEPKFLAVALDDGDPVTGFRVWRMAEYTHERSSWQADFEPDTARVHLDYVVRLATQADVAAICKTWSPRSRYNIYAWLDLLTATDQIIDLDEAGRALLKEARLNLNGLNGPADHIPGE